MSQYDVVNIRLTPKLKAHYEAEAARFGKPLSTYLRNRLESEYSANEQLEYRMNEVLEAIKVSSQTPETSNPDIESSSIFGLTGMVLENLFLTRLILKKVLPNGERELDKVISEVSRRGLPVAGENS